VHSLEGDPVDYSAPQYGGMTVVSEMIRPNGQRQDHKLVNWRLHRLLEVKVNKPESHQYWPAQAKNQDTRSRKAKA
jgi:hypothetical protein